MLSETTVVDVSQDWVLACDVQERFMRLPAAKHDRLSHSAQCRQVRALGGDCYDFFSQDRNRLAVVVGDASGKGLAAALMISNVQSSLRTAAALVVDDLAGAVEAVNRQVHASCAADRYATLFYGVFDETERTLCYVNAGHNPALVIRRDSSITRLEASGAPVGIFADSTYEEGFVQLGRGDLVVAYTDGVVEAMNAMGEEWGIEGLLRAVAKASGHAPDEMVEAIFASLDEFSCRNQTDDATVVVTRVN
jgi:phosphoserine phosphatase RsbU/P